MKEKCDREDCFAWTKARRYGNCCTALEEIPDNPAECEFFKTKMQVASEKLAMRIRAKYDEEYRHLLEYYKVKYRGRGRPADE